MLKYHLKGEMVGKGYSEYVFQVSRNLSISFQKISMKEETKSIAKGSFTLQNERAFCIAPCIYTHTHIQYPMHVACMECFSMHTLM